MRRLNYRAAATVDLRRLAAETRARWGNAQAAAYTAELRDAIKSLCEFPLRFPEFGTHRPGLRRMNCGRHAVFYLVDETQVEIVRVLHAAMDFDEWLG